MGIEITKEIDLIGQDLLKSLTFPKFSERTSLDPVTIGEIMQHAVYLEELSLKSNKSLELKMRFKRLHSEIIKRLKKIFLTHVPSEKASFVFYLLSALEESLSLDLEIEERKILIKMISNIFLIDHQDIPAEDLPKKSLVKGLCENLGGSCRE